MPITARNRLYEELSRRGFEPVHVAEVGVYLPENCNVLDYALAGVRTTLVEANPRIAERIAAFFDGRGNVTLHQVAIYDREGEIELYDRNASTFVGELGSSPAIVNDDYEATSEDRFVVPARKFSSVDDGTIDLLSVDIEGCEWFVIQHMQSRPRVISLETHGARYVNPHLPEILGWMQEHDYRTWYKDKSDTVFVHNGTFPIGTGARLRLLWQELMIRLRRQRKRLLSVRQ